MKGTVTSCGNGGLSSVRFHLVLEENGPIFVLSKAYKLLREGNLTEEYIALSGVLTRERGRSSAASGSHSETWLTAHLPFLTFGFQGFSGH